MCTQVAETMDDEPAWLPRADEPAYIVPSFVHRRDHCRGLLPPPVTSENEAAARMAAAAAAAVETFPYPELMPCSGFADFVRTLQVAVLILSRPTPQVVRLGEHGDAEGVRLLLQARADPSETDNFGFSALHGAAKHGHGDVASLLLHSGAEVDAVSKHRETPLHYACKYGREDVARLLLDAGADRSVVSAAGVTPVELARSRKHANLVALLTGS
mmetsp:Transcript_1285/g.3884  ORF Transcript_1285/g.3884 Transcript_1285/m.3884 type:complete len:215 (-) Transcript_1285:191-835(-)